LALAFVPARQGAPALLVSASRDRPEGKEKDETGLALWDAEKGTLVADLSGLPSLGPRPALAAWRTGAGGQDVRVAVALGDQRLRVWDAARGTLAEEKDVGGTVTAAALGGGDVLTAPYAGGTPQLRLWRAGGAGPE